MSAISQALTNEDWLTATSSYMDEETRRLRMLIRRRMLWLRKYWRRDAAPGQIGWAITDQEVELLLDVEDRCQEREFYQSDPAAQQLSAELEELDRCLYARRLEMSETGIPAPVDVLTARFHLCAFEREVLILCLAVELDPSFERIFAYLQDNASRRFATPHLAITLFDPISTGAARASFAPASPLRRVGLVRLEPSSTGGFLSGALRLEERILQYLSGVNQLEPRCASVFRLTPQLPLAFAHCDLAGQLAKRLQLVNSGGPNVINLVGPPDGGRLALAAASCELADLGLMVFDPKALPPPGAERREMIALAEREAVLLASGLFLDIDGLSPEETQALLSCMERLSVPLFIASRDRILWDHDFLPVRIVRPDSSSQARLWAEVLGEAGQHLSEDFEALVEQFDLGPSGITRAAASAVSLARLRNPHHPQVLGEDLWLACRQRSGPQIEKLACRIEPCYGWEDIVVPRDVLGQLHEITTQVAHRPTVYQRWGFAKKMSRGRGISALFSGASGVGKTMAAEVVARHLNLDLYRIDLAGMVSKYIGETQKNLRSVFDAAECSGAILFFDEADALFGKRSEVKDSHDRYANIEINYLLQRMEEYRGLAILATNMRETMDVAFLRRLRFIIDFSFPDATQRMEIWRRVFPSQAPVDLLDFAALARLEIPGGNIRNIAVNAAFLAVAEGSRIGMEQVMRAARREYTKMDRLILDSEFGRFSEGMVQ